MKLYHVWVWIRKNSILYGTFSTKEKADEYIDKLEKITDSGLFLWL